MAKEWTGSPQYRQDTRLTVGEARILTIGVTNDAGVDLTGATARYVVVRDPMAPPPALIEKTSPSQIAITVPPSGPYQLQLQVQLVDSDTNALAPGWYHHETTLQLANGAPITVMEGEFRLDPSQEW